MNPNASAPHYVAFAGGVGGAKLVHGLAQILPPTALTVIVNTGDDFEHFGLTICPDLDTVCYTLAGLANPETGWGRRDETWQALENVRRLGGPDWFRLGDRDLGTHLERTRRLRNGESLTQITQDFCRAWGIEHRILPMSDDAVRTVVHTEEYGDLPFQEYFVKYACKPRVRGFRFEGAATARPVPQALEALAQAQALILCPSNPWVSIDPILSIYARHIPSGLPVIAVSPIIGGQAVKGPAAKMFAELGISPSALAVAEYYRSLLTHFVIDQVDAPLQEAIAAMGIRVLVTQTLMRTETDRRRLAEDVLNFLREP
ncbi:MAG: 2-phospho-L-lactate transferase [Anaerolineales bacterium]